MSNISLSIEESEIKNEDNVIVPPPAMKIFINCVNSYHGIRIAQQILSQKRLPLTTEDSEFRSDEIDDDEIKREINLSQISVKPTKLSEIFYIYGTLEENDLNNLDDIDNSIEIINAKNDNFVKLVLDCEIIIYDISQNAKEICEAQKILKALENKGDFLKNLNVDQLSNYKKQKFILITSIMTWASTSIINQKYGGNSFKDEHYRKRRPHQCYTPHYNLEKEIINLQKRQKHFLRTLVVCPGITYGGPESVFHYLFKAAYLNSAVLEVFEPGNNQLPIIYVYDLARIIKKIIKRFPKRHIRYIFAVQPQSITYFNLAQIIAKNMCGDHCNIELCHYASNVDNTVLTQRVFNHFMINLNIQPSYLAEYPFTISGDMEQFGDRLGIEYRSGRHLQALKVLVSGAPCSGKTRIANTLAKYYGNHYISYDNLLSYAIEQIKLNIENSQAYLKKYEYKDVEVPDTAEAEESDSKNIVNDIETLNEETETNLNICPITTNFLKEIFSKIGNWTEKLEHLNQLNGQVLQGEALQFNDIKTLIIDTLSIKGHCENQGYILDGFPHIYAEAEQIFEEHFFENIDQKEAEEPIKTQKYKLNKKIVPDFVILLDGTDETICNSAMNIPEKDAVQTNNTEESMLNKLEAYHNRCFEDVSLLNYFLDRNIIPIQFRITDETKIDDIFNKIISIIGKPRIYPPSIEELDKIEQLKQEEKLRLEEEAAKLKIEKEEIEKERREIQLQEWANRLIKLKVEEQKTLEVKSLPIRHYLMKYIIPTLTQGLCEVIKFRPDDPIEFLAEYLLNFNPNYYRDNLNMTDKAKQVLATLDINLTEDNLEFQINNFGDYKRCMNLLN